MIKAIWAADRKEGLADQEFYRWWHQVHGLQEFGRSQVRRYVQHHTLAEVRDGAFGITPNRDGASIGWYDSFEQMRDAYAQMGRDEWSESRFDPEMDVVIAREQVILDGPVVEGMVKLITIVRRRPDVPVEEFQRAWRDDGLRWANVPGLRRSVQNGAILEAYETPYRIDHPERAMTHDGCSEDWFDSLEALRDAVTSREAMEARAHSEAIIDSSSTVYVIARETPIVG